jgi:tetratricopeptide (TPR) repeat protein
LHNRQIDDCLNRSEIAVVKPGFEQKKFDETGKSTGTLSAELRRLDGLLRASPGNDSMWRMRGRVLRQMGHVSGDVYIDEYLREAEKSFQKAIEINPKASANYGQLGINYLYQNNLQKSLETFHRSVALDHRSFEALQLGGLLSKRTSKSELAVSYFASAATRAETAEEKFWALNEQATLLCEQLSRCDEALRVQEKILKIDPKTAGHVHAAAMAYAKAGRWDRAIELEREALKGGDFPAARLELLKDLLIASESRIATGKPEQMRIASDFLVEALRLDPKNERVLSLLTQTTKAFRQPASR